MGVERRNAGGLSREKIDGQKTNRKQEAPSRPKGAAMITLLMLDAEHHCLATPADAPCYICRAPRRHAGPHEYVPIDMVMVADKAEEAAPTRVAVDEVVG